MSERLDTPLTPFGEALRLLGEWMKRADKHPEINEFRGGYQPFLGRATREFLAVHSSETKVSADEVKAILQSACDRDWKDESLYQTAMIVCNAIYWRDREIERLKACCAYDPYEERNRRDL